MGERSVGRRKDGSTFDAMRPSTCEAARPHATRNWRRRQPNSAPRPGGRASVPDRTSTSELEACLQAHPGVVPGVLVDGRTGTVENAERLGETAAHTLRCVTLCLDVPGQSGEGESQPVGVLFGGASPTELDHVLEVLDQVLPGHGLLLAGGGRPRRTVVRR